MKKDTQGWSRRSFLRDASAAAITGGAVMGGMTGLADAAERVRAKIRDIQTMEIQGTIRTYIFVRIITDDGQYGIAEGYGWPNVGLEAQVAAIKPWLVGKDPLEIDKIYTFLGDGTKALSGVMTDGSAHNQMNLASVLDMALWDLAGKLLNVPTSVLLGGQFRDHVRVYDHSGPKNMLDKASCRDWAAKVNAHPSGFTAHKIGLPRTAPAFGKGRGLPDASHDPSNRLLTTKELLNIGKSFENAREAIGWDHDIMVHCHWEYDMETAIQLAKVLEPIRPLWLEDPMIVDYSDAWKTLKSQTSIPILTGENLLRRQGFLPFVENRAISIVNPDVRNAGGFLETKRIADLASLFGIPMCLHNTGSSLATYQTCQFASSIRDFLLCETSTGDGTWVDDLIMHDEGPYIEKGYIKVTNKPGTGVRLNAEAVKARLVPGSKWWGGE